MFDAAIISAIREHARGEYPKEACGVVSGGSYLPLENIHEDPERHFRIDPAKYLDISTCAGIQAVVHSHPDGPDCPTLDDMEAQLATAVPWIIVTVVKTHTLQPFWFGDQAPMAPLLERTFRMGVHDCYALVRDWFRSERNILIPTLPRDPYCWEKSNFVEEHYRECGFVPIDGQPSLEGDVVSLGVDSQSENHLGVYLGAGLFMHHFPKRLSRREPIFPWMKLLRRVFRHSSLLTVHRGQND